MPRLILVRGLPGSGKTTFAKSLGIFHVEQDMRFMSDGEYRWSKDRVPDSVRFCRTAAKLAMLEKMDVVVSNTFTRVWEMEWYLDFAKYNGYDIFVRKADGNFGSVHNVPESSLIAMRDRWEDFEGELPLTAPCGASA